MRLETTLGAASLVIGVLGVLISLEVQLVAGALIIVGALAGMGLSVKAYRRPSLKLLYFSYRFEFVDDEGWLVRARRAARFRVDRTGVTQIWARGFSSSGRIGNFRSNIGEISVHTGAGSRKDVRVDFRDPLKVGDEFVWELVYDSEGAFFLEGDAEDSVSINGLLKAKTPNELSVVFPQSCFPVVVRRIYSGDNTETEVLPSIHLKKEHPCAIWAFEIRRGETYALRWENPKAA